MDKQLKRKWLKALRSRKYKQGAYQLKTYVADENRTEYCCLGVLCEVAGLDGHYGPTSAALHKNDLDLVGITVDQQDQLTAMNDGEIFKDKHYSSHKFYQIARWIERNL